MNWIKRLLKKAQVWQNAPAARGDEFAAQVKELYRLTYLYFSVQDRIRNSADQYMQRFINILDNLSARIVKVGEGIRKQLLPVMENWLRTHALTNPSGWARARMEGEFEEVTGEQAIDTALWEIRHYRDYGEDVNPFQAIYDDVNKLDWVQQTARDWIMNEDDETLTEVFGMPQGVDPVDWAAQVPIDDPLGMLGISNFDEMKDYFPDHVLREVAYLLNMKLAFPRWYNKWKREGIDQTRATVERNYNILQEADPRAVGPFISAINIALNTVHQNGSMLEYLPGIDDRMVEMELKELSNGAYTDQWDQQVETLFTPEQLPIQQQRAARAYTWLHKIAGDVQIDWGDYEQQVIEYLNDLAYKTESRQQELMNYNPQFEQLRSQLAEVGFPNPDQAIQALQSDDYWTNYQVYKQLSELYYQIPYNDPRRQYIEQLKVEIRNITDQHDKSTFSFQDAQQFAVQVIQQSKNRLMKIQALISKAISNIPDWGGSSIDITPDDPPSDFASSPPNYGSPISGAQISVGKQVAWGGPASFTLFVDWDENSDEIVKIEVDDILEGGDTDFFADNTITADYFNLVSELQHPGRSAQQQDKILTLYTARPAEHRQQYLEAHEIPPNIFLTSSYQSAVGMSQDFSKRDVWRVRIKSRYLVQTMNAPQEQWYQVKSQAGMVPVESIRLVDSWE